MKESISGIDGERARGMNDFIGRVRIGRPPERCRNQRGHPVVIIHRSPRQRCSLPLRTALRQLEKVDYFQSIDIVNRRTPPRRGSSQNRRKPSCVRGMVVGITRRN
jgi:hypothetical protein